LRVRIWKLMLASFLPCGCVIAPLRKRYLRAGVDVCDVQR
jgi:hypothetical protein